MRAGAPRRLMSATFSSAWVIHDPHDSEFSQIGDTIGLFLLSPADVLPTGSAVWVEACNGAWSYPRVSVSAIEPPKTTGECAGPGGLESVVAGLSAVCCPPAAPNCIAAGPPPDSCSPDCSVRWHNFAARCSADAALIVSAVAPAAAFFLTCGQVAVLPTQTVALETAAHHDFEFDAEAGVRYAFTVRTAAGSGALVPCTVDAYDSERGPGTCSGIISSGVGTCADSLCPTCNAAHYCDASCGLMCRDDGIGSSLLYVFAAGATSDTARASQTDHSADKGLGYTCTADGVYVLRVKAREGAGSVTASGVVVGTAAVRAPIVVLGDSPVAIGVQCHLSNCGFSYNGAYAIDGDGTAFDLQMHAVESTAYAVSVQLPDDQIGTAITLTFYYPAAAGGTAVFPALLTAALGDWRPTPPGHQSIPENIGCTNEDHVCWNTRVGAGASFQIHPGGSFHRVATATWAAPAAGRVLLHLAANCDVPIFADVQADGCESTNSAFDCPTSNNARCSSHLSLTVTAGAHFDANDGAVLATEMFVPPVAGPAIRSVNIDVSRQEAEALAAALWGAQPPAERMLVAPPTVEQISVQNSEAQSLLETLFVTEQQPHLVIPTRIEALVAVGGRRRLSEKGTPNALQLTVKATGPTGQAVSEALQQIRSRRVASSSGHRRELRFENASHRKLQASSAAVCTDVAQTESIQLSRQEAEALAAQMFAAQPAARRALQAPPTLEEMLVPDSEAQALLAELFVSQQPPHTTAVTSLAPRVGAVGQEGEVLASEMWLTIGVTATAPTAGAAEAGLAQLQALVSTGRRRAESAAPGSEAPKIS